MLRRLASTAKEIMRGGGSGQRSATSGRAASRWSARYLAEAQARQLGITRPQVAEALRAAFDGVPDRGVSRGRRAAAHHGPGAGGRAGGRRQPPGPADLEPRRRADDPACGRCSPASGPSPRTPTSGAATARRTMKIHADPEGGASQRAVRPGEGPRSRRRWTSTSRPTSAGRSRSTRRRPSRSSTRTRSPSPASPATSSPGAAKPRTAPRPRAALAVIHPDRSSAS